MSDTSSPPQFDKAEARRMLQRFLTEVQDDTANTQKWMSKMLDLTQAIDKSRKSLTKALELAGQAARKNETLKILGWKRSYTETATEEEWKVVKVTVEGTILFMARFSDFLRRVCANEALRMNQSTVKAQVEGDLMLMLSPQIEIYPDF
ncbi:uncharacterized protein PHALS_01510 [Plasmopara halstedii]|uniref:Uncharacterized protein n=1 Tax=Plasmopara halstedii TaxID=4781 RepID=A0A0N7L6T8_PLAHL|nr:uncharacterized protein PHALS_01510 [Plasmopara halstedii]CEG45195.1 hypothetical protein PHALS_01510 [Plasmopara halstedii]|eukprot:XP_024581564.1 hypothetical protein PHALS_01510 [Plasmopara halstedii]